MKLSILICDIPTRTRYIERLKRILEPQLTPDVEVLVDCTVGISIGKKRNILKEKAQGEYIMYLDSDDIVSGDYISSILESLKDAPDAVGFLQHRWVNGKWDSIAEISHKYTEFRATKRDGINWHERPINHLCPVKKSLVNDLSFIDKSEGEDCNWAFQIQSRLHNCKFIDKILYFYDYWLPGYRTDGSKTPQKSAYIGWVDRVLVKWATRQRYEKFVTMFEKWQNGRVAFLISLDEDDPDLAKYEDFLNLQENVTYVVGNSKNKIEAINADINEYEPHWDVLILAADDFLPLAPDYDKKIALHLLKYKDSDCVLHINDGRTGKLLNTMPIIGRNYYKRFNYIYNPEYQSLFCDNEFMDVSRKLDKVKYIDKPLFLHLWRDYVGMDDLMKRNELPHAHDKAVYARRKAEGFPPKH